MVAPQVRGVTAPVSQPAVAAAAAARTLPISLAGCNAVGLRSALYTQRFRPRYRLQQVSLRGAAWSRILQALMPHVGFVLAYLRVPCVP